MASLQTTSHPAPLYDSAACVRGESLASEIAAFFRQFIVAAFDPYRPELHYMRGPGPACRARHEASQ